MKSIALSSLAIFCTLSAVMAREPDLDSAEMWSGTWKRSDGGQTMTIDFKRDSLQCTISYSKGTPDTGKMRGDGEIIDFEGSTHGGMDHSSGTLTMSADHTKITKKQAVFGQDGPEKHLSAIYLRTGKSVSEVME